MAQKKAPRRGRPRDPESLSAEARRRRISPQRMHQQDRVLRGLCADCGLKRPKDLARYCRPCEDRHNQHWRSKAERYQAENRCISCGATGGWRRCADCKERHNARERQRRAAAER